MLRLALALLCFALPVEAIAADALPVPAEAAAFWEKVVALNEAYDPTVADLYDDSAILILDRQYPHGELKTVTLAAAQFKPIIRQAMPLAQAKGDRTEYTDVSFEVEGERVRINATRKPVLKSYSGPYSLLIGRNADGEWRIYEERAYTQPM